MAVPKVGEEDSSERLRQRFLFSSNFVMRAVNYPISCYEWFIGCFLIFSNSRNSRVFSVLWAILKFFLFVCAFIFTSYQRNSLRPPLIVGVLSNRANFMERLTLRNTWAVDLSSLKRETRLVFILGDSDCPTHPDLRLDTNNCKPINLEKDREFSWKNVNIVPNSHGKKSHDSCIHGFGLKAQTDILISSASSLNQIDTSKEKYFLRYQNTLVALPENYLVLKGDEVEIVMTSDANACESLNGKSCQWSNGSSVEYTFVRFVDGSIEPFSEQFCTPFIINFENGENICEEGWSSKFDNCYYSSETTHSRPRAESHCQELGSSLVSILSSNENNFVKGLRDDSNSIWLGLTHTENWEWSDGHSVSYTHWDKDEPNNYLGHEFCTEMRSDGKWNDQSCYTLNHYVCKKSRAANINSKSTRPADQEKWLRNIKTIEERVREESKTYGDIVMVNNLHDTYSSLPMKVKGLIKWTHTNYPGAWLFKTDDDTYVNIPKVDDIIRNHLHGNSLLGVMSHFLTASHSSPAVFSHFTKMRSVPYFGKNAEHGYSSLTYPPFPAGSGYLMTDLVVESLAEALPSLRPLQGEDVSVGMWLSALNFKKLPTLNPLSYKQVVGYLYNILEVLFAPIMAQVSKDRYLQIVSLPQDENYVPPVLINAPCWVEGADCKKEEAVVVSDQSIIDLVKRFDANR